MESLVDSAIFEMDPAGRITLWNAGAEYVTGFTPEEAIGQSGAKIFTGEDRERGVPEREMEAARTGTGGRIQDERWHVRRGGGLFWGSGGLACVYGAPGGP